MTLDCTPKLVERLEARLRIAEQTRVARFGLHQPRNDYVYFVYGAAGGYTAAAQLK